MNLPSANSRGSAKPLPPPPLSEFFLVLPDGSCIPATPDTCCIVMRQTRSEVRKQKKIKRHEKAVELQMALEDRTAARSLHQELAELNRGSVTWAARFKVRVEPKRPATRTSPVIKRSSSTQAKASVRNFDAPQLASSWAVDERGMKGVIWQQSYLGRKSPRFHRGMARQNWEYIVRDEAVLLDAGGEPIIISNMGEDWIEIGTAWQVMEDASTRANAKIQLLAIAPFDSDMSESEMIAALSHFCHTILGPLGLPYSAAIHAPPEHGDQRNFHPHIAFSLRPMRRVEPYGWEVADDVCGELDGRDGVQMLRHLWAHSLSAAADQAQSGRRYTGLGYGARRLDLEAGEHLGEARSAIVSRGGHVVADARNRIKARRNAARRAIRDADRKIAALTTIRDAALRRIERRVNAVGPAKLVCSAPSARVPTLLKSASGTIAAMNLTPLAATLSAKTVSHALTAVPSRQHIKAVIATVPPTLTMGRQAATSAKIRTPTITPVRPALHSTVTKSVAVRTQLTARPALKSALTYEPAQPHRQAAPLLVTSVARRIGPTISSPSPARSPVKPLVAATAPLQRDNVATVILEMLTYARLPRSRKRRNGPGGDVRRLDSLPVLGTVAGLDTLPTLDRLVVDAVSRLPVDLDRLSADDQVRVARLKAIDPYVAAYGGDDVHVETDYPVLKALGVGWDWLQTSRVQQALRNIRAEQQQVVVQLADLAAARPLAFTKASSRFWPRDLAADQLRRLDSWANDPGFEQDVFEMQQAISQAHDDHNAERRRQTSSEMNPQDRHVGEHRTGGTNPGLLQNPIDDGLGATRNTAPAEHPWSEPGLNIRPFDVPGTPTVSLLLLLQYAGEHPDKLELANDGRITGVFPVPALIRPLINQWRHDDRIHGLVVNTVRASRAAGRPVWPPDYAMAIRTGLTKPGSTAAPQSVHEPGRLR